MITILGVSESENKGGICMKSVTGILLKVVRGYSKTNLVLRIVIAIVIGAGLGFLFPGAEWLNIPGTLFVSALKAIAPLLVFVLVISSLANGNKGFDRRFGFVIVEYLVSTFIAAAVAVLFCYLFPITMQLPKAAGETVTPPSGLGEVLETLLLTVFSNPVSALSVGNYVSILFWAVVIGILMNRMASDGTKQLFTDFSGILSRIISGIINLAPFGILGLVYNSRFVCLCGLRETGPFAGWNHGNGCAGDKSADCFSDSAQKSVSAGFPVHPGKRTYRILHTFIRSEHSGQYAAL